MLILLALAAQAVDLTADVRREVRRQECAGTKAASDEVIVCGRRKAGERYRLSEADLALDPANAPPSVARERSKWVEQGDSGTNSCGAVGPGGWTGCMQQGWRKQRQQHMGWFGN